MGVAGLVVLPLPFCREIAMRFLTVPFSRSVVRSPRSRRGVTLIELAVAMIVLAIIIIIAFAIFGWHQMRMVQLEIREQMQMVLDNQVEWALSTEDYALVDSDEEDVEIAGRSFHVVTDVEEHDTAGNDPRWKEIEITVYYGGTDTATADLEKSVTAIRSRSR